MFSMLLNTLVFGQVVAVAKAAAAGNPALLRAIARAVVEINRAKYWAYDSQADVLKLKSTSSGKLYIVDNTHTCEALANGHKFCKHTVARRLLKRYAEKLNAATVEVETKAVCNWSSRTGHEVVETKRQTVSTLAKAEAAVYVPRTLKGETYAGVAI